MGRHPFDSGLRKARSTLWRAAGCRNTQLLAALAALYAGPDDYYINFYGPPGTIRTIPYECLLRARTAAQTPPPKQRANEQHDLRGRADLNDPDQPDRFYTSFTGKDGVDLSGVEIMATAYANLLSGRTLTPSPAAIGALAVVAFGLLVGLLAYLLPATAAVPTVFAVTASMPRSFSGDLMKPIFGCRLPRLRSYNCRSRY